MKRQYRKSDINIVVDDNVKLITNRNMNLIDANITIVTVENVEFEYNLVGKNLNDLKLKKHEKLQVLYKLSNIVINLERLDFDINPDNVYVEIDGNVKICERSINQASAPERDWKMLKQLIALTGFLIEGISYEQLLEVDSEQLTNSKQLASILEATSVSNFRQEIGKLLQLEVDKLHDDQVIISKNKYKQLKNNKLGYRLGLVATVAIALVMATYIIPFKNTEIKLYEAYQTTDSGTILSIVSDININRMSNEEKLIADKAIINDQVELDDAQKSMIMNNLDSKTNGDILDYWLYIGKGEFDAANNNAIALSDADMQMYALLQLINEAQNNDELEATERKELIDGYEQQIKELESKKAEANGDANE